MNTETLKAIGWLLLGVGVLLIGTVGFLMYIKITSFEYPREPFYAFCEEGYIKIKASKDLHNVLVIYDNKTVCRYNLIKKGSSRVCDVSSLVKRNVTVFLIKSNEGEDIIRCFEKIVYLAKR